MAVYSHILLALDLTDESATVADHARQLADRLGAEISLVHVIEPFSFAYGGEIPIDLSLIQEQVNEHARKRLEDVATRLEVPEARRHVVFGRPEAEIQRLAEEVDADLIVVGSHGRHGFALLFGSTTDDVVHRARCDVLTVHVEPG